MKSWPTTDTAKPLAFLGYKAGMTHLVGVDNRAGSLTFGKEVMIPATIIETPPMIAYGLRAYEATSSGLRSFSEAWTDNPPRELARVTSVPEKTHSEEKLRKIESALVNLAEVRLLVASQPRLAKIGRKTPELMEVKVGGKSSREQFDFCKSVLGRELRISDVIKEGQMVDVAAVTKGKGIQGPVKRWGIRRLQHKSRKRVRGVGTLGAWHPHYVMYSVPRAGQMGFFKRTDYNVHVLKIGEDGAEVTPKGGLMHYGVVKNSYVLLRGSLPGPVKRTLTIRPALRITGEIALPKIEHINIHSREGG